MQFAKRGPQRSIAVSVSIDRGIIEHEALCPGQFAGVALRETEVVALLPRDAVRGKLPRIVTGFEQIEQRNAPPA